jgi:antitoxin MazE
MPTIQKWGNSLAVRLPAGLARQLELEVGTEVEISAENETLVLRPRRRCKYQLEVLLRSCRPQTLHGEVDFDQDVGGEVLD